MNVAKRPIPQVFRRSGTQCPFLSGKEDEQRSLIPNLNIPWTLQHVLPGCIDQQCSEHGLIIRGDTRGISSFMVLDSQLEEPRFSVNQQEDSDLLQRVALRGDEALEAFTTLYTRHHEKLRRFCHIFLKNPDRVEEVTQEVWLEIWTEAGTYRGEAKVMTWMFGRAKNHCHNKWRKEERKDPYHLPIVNVEPQDVGSPSMEISVSVIENREANESLDPAVKVEVRDRHRVLGDAIAMLAPLDQAMLHLVYREEKSLWEVSQILGKPEGTVKRRLSNTRRTLRKELEKRESI
jgi:RNA polymerase sigma-70 factor, ECF subfamily